MSEIVDKWGQPVAERGFAQIPNYLLLLNIFVDREDRLSPLELLVLVQLVGVWWKKEDLPYPSVKTLAIRCGASERQVARALNRLEEISLIQRRKRRSKGLISSNSYDLSPLVEMLQEAARQYPNEFPRKVAVPRKRLSSPGERAKARLASQEAAKPPRRRIKPKNEDQED